MSYYNNDRSEYADAAAEFHAIDRENKGEYDEEYERAYNHFNEGPPLEDQEEYDLELDVDTEAAVAGASTVVEAASEPDDDDDDECLDEEEYYDRYIAKYSEPIKIDPNVFLNPTISLRETFAKLFNDNRWMDC